MTEENVKIIEKKYEIMSEQSVTFLLIKFESSFMLWIGESANRAKLENLALAIAKDSTSILGSNADLLSPALASKLSIKYNNRPVYVAYNYPNVGLNNDQFIVGVNKQIIQFLNESLS
jgi:hypothetical protein